MLRGTSGKGEFMFLRQKRNIFLCADHSVKLSSHIVVEYLKLVPLTIGSLNVTSRQRVQGSAVRSPSAGMLLETCGGMAAQTFKVRREKNNTNAINDLIFICISQIVPL